MTTDNAMTNTQNVLWTFIASQESGELSLDPHDRGNWTSGTIGIGTLKGSKWGISAATFPEIDIASVTCDQAKQICMAHYWPAVKGDLLCSMGAIPLAMVMTDACWISGPVPAIEALQRALRLNNVDGIWGNITQTALQHAVEAPGRWGLDDGLCCVLTDFIAERIEFESHLDTWSRYEGGWVRRLTRVQCLAQGVLPV